MTKEIVHLVDRLTKLYSWVISCRNHAKTEFIGKIIYFVRRKMFLNGTFFEAIKNERSYSHPGYTVPKRN